MPASVGKLVRTEQETLLAYGKVIARLRGLTRDSGCIEAEIDAREPGGKRQGMGPCRHEVPRLMASYLLGDHADARVHSEAAATKLATFGRSLQVVEHNFYTSLNLAAECERRPARTAADLIQAIADNQRQLEIWARNCPENFLHKRLLVEAELARLQERELEAAELYERAIGAAAAEGFLHEEALANELAGRFHRGQDRRRFGQLYLRRAVELYRRWGARAKVERLEQEFPDLPPVEGPAELPGAGAVERAGAGRGGAAAGGRDAVPGGGRGSPAGPADGGLPGGRRRPAGGVAAGGAGAAVPAGDRQRGPAAVGGAAAARGGRGRPAGAGRARCGAPARCWFGRARWCCRSCARAASWRRCTWRTSCCRRVFTRAHPVPAPAVRADRHVAGKRPAVPRGPGGHPPARRVPGGGLARAEHAAGVAAADGAGAGGGQPGREPARSAAGGCS